MSQYDRNTWYHKLFLWIFRKLFGLWPPYLGTGIKIDTISTDYRHVEVSMKLHWYNQNYSGVHFGGSIYAMTDPFYMLILIKNLGKEYIVWDKAALIEFKKPGRGKVSASFTFTKDEIQAVKHQADTNKKFIFDKSVDVVNQEGIVVATVMKTLYVRKNNKREPV